MHRMVLVFMGFLLFFTQVKASGKNKQKKKTLVNDTKAGFDPQKETISLVGAEKRNRLPRGGKWSRNPIFPSQRYLGRRNLGQSPPVCIGSETEALGRMAPFFAPHLSNESQGRRSNSKRW